jgi:integrase
MARGDGGIFYQKASRFVWIRYWRGGKQIRESSQSTSVAEARKLLRMRVGDKARGHPDLARAAQRTTFEQLAALIVDDYAANQRRSAKRLQFSLAHLSTFFSGYRASAITSAEITRYARTRLGDGAASASVNRELTALKRMYKLALIAGQVSLAQVPHVAMLQEANTRTGFFEREQFEALLRHLPLYLRFLFEVAYLTGWGVKDELCSRQRQHVDLKAGWLRLEPGETKNGEGRMFPLIPALRTVLEHQLAHTVEVERRTGQIVPWLFHRDGEPIKDYRRAWRTAVQAAGLPGKIPHDFRRTAVRNLERAGVSRSAAMKMVGHRTESIYRRYATVSEGDLREAGAKLAALWG